MGIYLSQQKQIINLNQSKNEKCHKIRNGIIKSN